MSHIRVEFQGLSGPLDDARAAAAAMTPAQRLAASLGRLNSDLLFLLRPVLPAIQRMPSHPPMLLKFKQDVVNRPVDALLDLFAPIEALAADTITEATNWSKKPTRVVTPPGFPPVTAKMYVDQPEDVQLDATTRAFIRRLRIVNNFAILVVFDPVALSVGLARALFARGLWVKNQLDAFMATLPSPAKIAQEAADAASRAKDAAEKAAAAARLGTQTAADQAIAAVQGGASEGLRRLGLAGYNGLGAGPAAVAVPALPAAVQVVVNVCQALGAMVTPPMATLIAAIIGGLVTVSTAVVTAGAGVAVATSASRRGDSGGSTSQAYPDGGGGAGPGGGGPAGPGGGPQTDSGIPLPLLLVGAGLAFMALKK